MNGLAGLGGLWNSIRAWLFPVLEDELGELDEKHKEFVTVCELCAPGADMSAYTWVGNGQPPKSRLALWKAFVAKAVWDFPTTRDLIDAVRHRPTLRRLCGWETLGEVPSEAVFSRAFDDFAQLGHVALIDHNPRRGEKREFAPAEAVRYRERSAVERVNSHLHDNHGGRHVRVRGAAKVAAHLSFGLLVIAAEQLLNLLC